MKVKYPSAPKAPKCLSLQSLEILVLRTEDTECLRKALARVKSQPLPCGTQECDGKGQPHPFLTCFTEECLKDTQGCDLVIWQCHQEERGVETHGK